MRLSSDNLSPEDVAMTVTAMSIARYVSLSGLALTSYQWMEVEDHFGNDTEKFEMSHMIIDSESGASVANICKKVMVVVLYHVDFQDLNVFFRDASKIKIKRKFSIIRSKCFLLLLFFE